MPRALLRDRWLGAMVLARILMTAVFMAYAACMAVLIDAWAMTGAQAGLIAGGFHFGYMLSLMGFSWAADRLGAVRVFLISAAASAASAVLFALFARSFESALALFALVALTQGGTYYPAIMLIAERYPADRRGAAMGWLIASTSLGYALSLGVAGAMLALGGYALAFTVTGALTVLGGALAVYFFRTTPNVVRAHARERSFVREFAANPAAMKAVGGYAFHCWELLGMWAWMPAFLAACLAAAGGAPAAGVAGIAAGGALLMGALHVIGFVASSSMGRLSDRAGRRTVMVALAGASTACSFTIGWTVGWPLGLVLALGAVYAFTALGDSPVLSTTITEVTPPAYLGGTLALRGVLGFGAGALAPLAFGFVIDLTNPGGGPPSEWGWAFAVLGAGGLAATLVARSLPRAPRGE